MDKFLRFTLVFLGTYLLLSFFLAPSEKTEDFSQKDDIEITLSDDEPTLGNLVEVHLLNNTDSEISLGKGTPPEQLSIAKYQNGEWKDLRISDEEKETILIPHQSQTFSYEKENTDFFNKEGRYKVTVSVGEKNFEHDIQVQGVGFFTFLWRTFVWEPVYNLLIILIEFFSMNLGWAIIALTLIIKILLFIPTQKGMKSQRIMQKLQPELQKIRSQNKGNQQKIAMASMELWKKHNVNPMGAMIPLLLQFPFLIALFYVIKEGLAEHQKFFLYPIDIFQNFDYSAIQTTFLGIMDLLKSPFASGYIYLLLPVVIAIVQYFAMKLSFARMKKKKEEQKKKNTPQPNSEGFMADFQKEFEKMNGVFIYFFPAMILIFSATMPMALGIYWLISTLFSIGQQYVVNKEVG